MTTKDKLLWFLKEQSQQWVSGESLSLHLNISRAAVNKHVHRLREEGYSIAAVPKKGYCLEKSPDRFLENEILDGLQTKVLGKTDIVCLQSVDSTNTIAKELALDHAPEGTLVVAETQTAGRGRKGRSWLSPEADGIYASLILRPAIEPADAFKFTLIAGVATAEAILAETNIPVCIKWPNDILTDGKKIAGILAEISMETDMVDYIILGLGMNINTPPESFAPELKEIASSLLIAAGQPFSRLRLIRSFLLQMETYYNMFTEQGFSSILERWKALSNTVGREISVDVIGKTHRGLVKDIDHDGRLILEDPSGKSHHLISGDVTFIDA